ARPQHLLATATEKTRAATTHVPLVVISSARIGQQASRRAAWRRQRIRDVESHRHCRQDQDTRMLRHLYSARTKRPRWPVQVAALHPIWRVLVARHLAST
ncbi:hypothetical protein, partial [Xanthomonas sacchari]|uniref:hypothetical protein n=1 Tax=Xanthomonas sacchari TaxID=56458 RepID=UPI002253A64F